LFGVGPIEEESGKGRSKGSDCFEHETYVVVKDVFRFFFMWVDGPMHFGMAD